jgi:hypothetical protein
MNKYNNDKIYTIRCTDDNNLIYVGSTIQPLHKRWNDHKKRYNKESSEEYFKLLYVQMREIGIDNFYIELYEDFPCERKEQLNKKEGEIIRQIGTLNKVIAGRTPKEYYDDNKELISEKGRWFRDENKDEIKRRHQIYNEKNKEVISEKGKDYYEQNKDIIKEKRKEYYEKNKEKISEKKKAYYEKIKK